MCEKNNIKSENSIKYEFRKISEQDGIALYNLLQEIPLNDNGFENKIYGKTLKEFEDWLKYTENESKAIGLPQGRVPMTTFCLYANDEIIAIGRLRHRLTPSLMKIGGNISYAVSPSQRKKGYGTMILHLILEEAKKLGLKKVLITCDKNNLGSYKVIEKNGGILEEITDGERKYRIEL